MGAVCGVGTPPEWRGRGLVSALMERLMEATGRSRPNAPMGLMWRINDLPDLLRQVQPVLEQRLIALSPDRQTPERVRLPGARASRPHPVESGVALDVYRDRVEIARPGGAPGSPGFLRCRLAQADLVTLLLGSYPSAAWLEGLGLPEEAQPWLARLFPPSGGVFWLTDNLGAALPRLDVRTV